MSEKIAVGRNIYGIGVPVVKEIRHDFFQDADLITLRVKRQERSLFLICQSGKALKNSGRWISSEVFDLSAVKIIFIETGPDILIFGSPFPGRLLPGGTLGS